MTIQCLALFEYSRSPGLESDGILLNLLIIVFFPWKDFFHPLHFLLHINLLFTCVHVVKQNIWWLCLYYAEIPQNCTWPHSLCSKWCRIHLHNHLRKLRHLKDPLSILKCIFFLCLQMYSRTSEYKSTETMSLKINK